MNKNKVLIAGILAGVLSVCATAADSSGFTPPSSAQIAAAARNPAINLPALLADANASQAAEVVKLVLAEVFQLELDPALQSARITAIINVAFGTIPPELYLSFSSALGAAVAGSGAITLVPGASSSIQGAIAARGGEQAAALAQAFLQSYLNNLPLGTSQTSANDPPPIVTPKYSGQNL
ncbi:MAG: hypothetical protein MUC65_00760 [Pontiellaceae bacterium]|jgi:hypothetical protein|nr:hypothetical protein [Pontiellaceae bacterium]